MLKLQAAPTFTAKVGIPVPGAEPIDVRFVFKHMTREALESFLTGADAAARSDVETIMAIAEGWHDVDQPFGREAVELLTQNYHGSARAVLSTYVTELAAARLGN